MTREDFWTNVFQAELLKSRNAVEAGEFADRALAELEKRFPSSDFEQ